MCPFGLIENNSVLVGNDSRDGDPKKFANATTVFLSYQLPNLSVTLYFGPANPWYVDKTTIHSAKHR